MPDADRKPDLGAELRSRGFGAEYALDPLVVAEVGRLGNGEYFLFGSVPMKDGAFEAMVGMNGGQFAWLLSCCKPEMAATDAELLMPPDGRPLLLTLRQQVTVRVVATLGMP